jgi:S-adenosylmethionine uptake transporter
VSLGRAANAGDAPASGVAPLSAEPPADTPSRRAVATMLASCSFFAVMSTLVAAAHARDPALTVWTTSAVRAAVNLVVLAAMARFSPRALLGDGRPALWLRGVMGAASLLLYFGSLARIGAGEAAFLNFTSSFWVAALAPLLLGERTRPAVWAAIALSVVGTGLLGWPRAGDPALLGDSSDLIARAAGLISGLTAAIAYVSVRRASVTNAPIVIVFYFTLVGTVATGIGLLLTPAPLPVDPLVWTLLVGAGVAATGGQLLMTAAYALGPAAPLSATTAATPLFTTLLAVALLGHVPDAVAALGMALLATAGVALPLLSARRASARGG